MFHPAGTPPDEGQMPPDLSQAQAVTDKVVLVYLALGLSDLSPGNAIDLDFRMLVPAWIF